MRGSREFLTLSVDGVRPGSGQMDFEPSEEAQGEDDEQQEEEDVEDGIGRHGIERVAAEEGGDEQAETEVDDDDAQAVGHSIADAFLPVIFRPFEEETDGHGDDGPDAGHADG